MGACCSDPGKLSRHFMRIKDRFKTLQSLQEELLRFGLDKARMVFAVDFTASNRTSGRRTFRGLNLHTIFPEGEVDPQTGEPRRNPYEEVMRIMSVVLDLFRDADAGIPAFGFGDIKTTDSAVFDFAEGRDEPLKDFDAVLERYHELVPTLTLSGPTSFAPAIRKTLELVKKTGEYHILIIIADGQINDHGETKEAIVEASHHPMSIITVGVGDGPWDMMEHFDDTIRGRRFDNFQFVDFFQCVRQTNTKKEVNFALNAMMEIPDQVNALRKLGLLPPLEASRAKEQDPGVGTSRV